MKYSFTSRIRYSEIGEDGCLTLPGLINYFQDCSTFQSEAIGEGVAELKKQAVPGYCPRGRFIFAAIRLLAKQ